VELVLMLTTLAENQQEEFTEQLHSSKARKMSMCVIARSVYLTQEEDLQLTIIVFDISAVASIFQQKPHNLYVGCMLCC
jgi:hypothetical protein